MFLPSLTLTADGLRGVITPRVVSHAASGRGHEIGLVAIHHHEMLDQLVLAMFQKLVSAAQNHVQVSIF